MASSLVHPACMLSRPHCLGVRIRTRTLARAALSGCARLVSASAVTAPTMWGSCLPHPQNHVYCPRCCLLQRLRVRCGWPWAKRPCADWSTTRVHQRRQRGRHEDLSVLAQVSALVLAHPGLANPSTMLAAAHSRAPWHWRATPSPFASDTRWRTRGDRVRRLEGLRSAHLGMATENIPKPLGDFLSGALSPRM